MIYNRTEHKYTRRSVNYIIKSGLIVLSLALCLPIYGGNEHFCSNKNELKVQPVVNAFLNLIKEESDRKSVQIRKIVIDAGHGGKDHGCGGHHSNEKHIVLDIAKQVKAMLRTYHPELEVIMTREHDVFIPLYKRIEIANKNNADLFISIHCNSLDIKSVRGTETYVMGLHTAAENLAVAKRENDVILMEQNYFNNYDGFDPNSDEGHIMLAMSQNEHLTKSINFANKLERSFAKRTKLKSRGVKQAGFVVLKRATMPSVLIETGFISNIQDEGYLMSKNGKAAMADAIVKAFTLYKRELDDEQNNYNDVAVSTSTAPYQASTSPSITPRKTVASKPPRMVQAHEINDPNHHKIISITPGTSASNTQQKAEIPSNNDVKHHKIISNKASPNSTSLSAATTTEAVQNQVRAVSDNGKRYKVQIAASVNKPIEQKSAMWQKVKNITIRQEENMYKYLTGNFMSLESANQMKSQMRDLGFKGAFVVAYAGENRINL